MKTTTKLVILWIARIIGIFAPLLILVIINKDEWLNFETKTGPSVTIGLILALIVAILWLLKLMKKANGLIWMIILAVICTFLEPLMKDVTMIAWTSTISAAANFFLTIPIKRLTTTREYEIQSKSQANAMSQVVAEVMKGSGRA